jgi:hypothetical protein
MICLRDTAGICFEITVMRDAPRLILTALGQSSRIARLEKGIMLFGMLAFTHSERSLV